MTEAPPGPAPRRAPGPHAYSVPYLLGAAACVVPVVMLALLQRDGVPSADAAIGENVHTWVTEHPPWPRITRIISSVTSPSTVRVVAALSALALILAGMRAAAGWLVATVALGSLLAVAAKPLVDRARPAWPDPIGTASGSSFPSSHAVNSTVAAGCCIVIWHLLGRLGGRAASSSTVVVTLAAIALPLISGVGRVMLGVHWASDVLAGWAAGAGVVLLMAGLFPAVVAPSASSAK